MGRQRKMQRIDRQFRGVGRLVLGWGNIKTAAEKEKRDAFLTRLYEHGRLDLLRALRDHVLDLNELYALERSDPLFQTVTGEGAVLNKPLWAAVNTWLTPPTGSKLSHTDRRYKVAFAALKARAGLPETATIEALAGVDWHDLKKRWERSNSDWFQLRAAVSHFLALQLGGGNAKLGAKSQWRLKVMDGFPRVKPTERVPDLNVAIFWKIVQAAPEFVRPALVCIGYLGLRVSEYLALTDTDLLPATKQIRIRGTKTEGSDAVLPVAPEMWDWLKAAVHSPLGYKWLRIHFKRAVLAAEAEPGLRLHDLRHLPAMALTEAGRSEASVQQTMRHASATMTRKYARQRDRGENAAVLANLFMNTGS